MIREEYFTESGRRIIVYRDEDTVSTYTEDDGEEE